jgi:ParB family chromosome partitioning protein
VKPRKKFGISQDLSRGLAETINAVKNNIGALRYEVLPLSRIEIDPKNPRVLAVSGQDIEEGLKSDDPLFEKKKDELDRLNRLGETIKKKGLINAIVVYRKLDKYRLVAGERRFLASLLIGKEDIQARVFEEEPSEDDLRMLQWIENTEREDLTLNERLGNIRAIISGLKARHSGEEITATTLKDILSVSLPHASNYVSLLKAPHDIQEKIEDGKINSIEKGAFISKIGDPSVRTKLIKECEAGASLRELQSLVTSIKQVKNEINNNSRGTSRVGKPLSMINLGTTKNPNVVETVVKCVIERPEFNKYAAFFDKIEWHKLDQAKHAFKKMVEFLETEK